MTSNNSEFIVLHLIFVWSPLRVQQPLKHLRTLDVVPSMKTVCCKFHPHHCIQHRKIDTGFLSFALVFAPCHLRTRYCEPRLGYGGLGGHGSVPAQSSGCIRQRGGAAYGQPGTWAPRHMDTPAHGHPGIFALGHRSTERANRPCHPLVIHRAY